MKHCTKCNRTKSLDEFGSNKATRDGLAAYCRPCMNAYNVAIRAKHRQQYAEASRQSYRRNIEKRREYDRARKQKLEALSPQQIAMRKARKQAWSKSNLERTRVRLREWRAANAERSRAQSRVDSARREARKRSLPSFSVISKDVSRILASSCAVTGCTNTDIQIDHVIPIARGGSHGIGNLQPLCAPHNASKGARLWIEFRAYLARCVAA